MMITKNSVLLGTVPYQRREFLQTGFLSEVGDGLQMAEDGCTIPSAILSLGKGRSGMNRVGANTTGKIVKSGNEELRLKTSGIYTRCAHGND